MNGEQYTDGSCRFWIEHTAPEVRDEDGTVIEDAHVVIDAEWRFGVAPEAFTGGDWYENCKREVIAMLTPVAETPVRVEEITLP